MSMKEQIRKIIRDFSLGKEVIENGQRFLIVNNDKKPFGSPYPDTIEKYIVREIILLLNNTN